jgi:2-polyprenyl-3-methyl-5-hydroxy-6-metoxy-1,4-benzoquinol methylase
VSETKRGASDAGRFDAHGYWQARHRKYGADFRGVGNVSLACDANERQIQQKALLLAHLLGRLGVARGARVLDAGCGRGYLTMLLAQIGLDCVGVDVSKDAVENAYGRDRITYVQSPLATLNLGESFAAVLCIDVLYHVVDDDEWQRTLAALHAHTQPGGHLCIVENLTSEPSQSPHCRWRTLADYESFCGQAGSRIVGVDTYTPLETRREKSLLVIQT